MLRVVRRSRLYNVSIAAWVGMIALMGLDAEIKDRAPEAQGAAAA